MLQVKIKKFNEKAVIPAYAKPGDAGLDLVATDFVMDGAGNVIYRTGIAIEIPQGYVGLLFPRSSNAVKDLLLSNSVGVIDSGYRGEIMLKFKTNFRIINNFDIIQEQHNNGETTEKLDIKNIFNKIYSVGDKVGQLIILPYPQIEFEEVEELSKTERGEGGYGSTGK